MTGSVHFERCMKEKWLSYKGLYVNLRYKYIMAVPDNPRHKLYYLGHYERESGRTT
jgi:hypothetical protein